MANEHEADLLSDAPVKIKGLTQNPRGLSLVFIVRSARTEAGGNKSILN